MRKNNRYTKEFKLKAVKMYLGDGYSYSKVTDMLQIKSNTQVIVWVKKFKELDDTAFDTELVQNTMNKIFKMPLKKDCIVHTDQGFQYTRREYCAQLKAHNIKQSMSRKGNCWDNAPIESFFSHFKSELIHFLTGKTSIESMKDGISRYIKFYNEERMQLKLKGLSPVEYRKQAS